MCHVWHSSRKEVRKFMMKRTISGMIGAGSLAHNRRDFVAENVNPDRVQLNICYKNENLKEVYKELFDDAVDLQIRISADRRGKMTIVAAGKPEMPERGRRISRLLHAAQGEPADKGFKLTSLRLP